MRRGAPIGCILGLSLLCSVPAQGQTRAAEIARQQEKKAREAEAYVPNRGEVVFDGLERWAAREHRWLPSFASNVRQSASISVDRRHYLKSRFRLHRPRHESPGLARCISGYK